jgi:hypothetical protein
VNAGFEAEVARRALAPSAACPVWAAAEIARLAGGEVDSCVFFGSRKTRPTPDPWSAYDLFVVVRSYEAFYVALRRAGAVRGRPGLLALLNRVMPPNQLFLWPEAEGRRLHAKCAVISARDLRRETSASRRDHFCVARLFQPAEVAYARGDPERAAAVEAILGAQRATFGWVAPSLTAEFGAEEYGRTLLRVSMASEIRPEPPGRADQLFEAQREYHHEVQQRFLEELAESGRLERVAAGRFRLRAPVSPGRRLAVRGYFAWSKLRATARWLKYVVTVEGWLDYIVHKAERHSGRPVELRESERRLPLLLLWPRVVRYLRGRGR